jgi:hypothetical protein
MNLRLARSQHTYTRLEMKANEAESRVVRKRKAEERTAANVRKKAKQATDREHAETILSSSLVTSLAELEIQLQARCSVSSACCAFLRDQFHARVSSDTPRQYPGLGPEFRSKHGKLKLTPSDGTTNKEAYLKALINYSYD